MTESNLPTDGTNRRSVLRGMSVVAAAGGLAACSKEEQEAAKSSASSLASDASTNVSSAAQSASSAASEAVSGGVSVPKSKVPVGSGFVDKDNKFVVSQPTAGNFKAFSNICTHEKCAMTRVDGDAIVCACHGSAFSLADGSVINGPADKALDENKVGADGDNLKIS